METKYIKMSEDTIGYPDYITPVMYKKGEILEVVKREKDIKGNDKPMPHIPGRVPNTIAEGFLSDARTSPVTAIICDENGKEPKVKKEKEEDKADKKSEIGKGENKAEGLRK